MKAIFTGTLRTGFSPTGVLPDEQADALVATLLAGGTLVDAVPVQPPGHLSPGHQDFSEGHVYIFFRRGLLACVHVYGPFPTLEDAVAFGEDHRAHDSWELFEVPV